MGVTTTPGRPRTRVRALALWPKLGFEIYRRKRGAGYDVEPY